MPVSVFKREIDQMSLRINAYPPLGWRDSSLTEIWHSTRPIRRSQRRLFVNGSLSHLPAERIVCDTERSWGLRPADNFRIGGNSLRTGATAALVLEEESSSVVVREE